MSQILSILSFGVVLFTYMLGASLRSILGVRRELIIRRRRFRKTLLQTLFATLFSGGTFGHGTVGTLVHTAHLDIEPCRWPGTDHYRCAHCCAKQVVRDTKAWCLHCFWVASSRVNLSMVQLISTACYAARTKRLLWLICAPCSAFWSWVFTCPQTAVIWWLPDGS
jgi:hypothetical protein